MSARRGVAAPPEADENVVARMTDDRGVSWRLTCDDIMGAEVQRRPPGMPWAFARRFPIHSETWPADIDYAAKLAELVARISR